MASVVPEACRSRLGGSGGVTLEMPEDQPWRSWGRRRADKDATLRQTPVATAVPVPIAMPAPSRPCQSRSPCQPPLWPRQTAHAAVSRERGQGRCQRTPHRPSAVGGFLPSDTRSAVIVGLSGSIFCRSRQKCPGRASLDYFGYCYGVEATARKLLEQS
jgi:hypothetical protein